MSAGARRDLLDIWLFGARNWGEARAQACVEEIDAAIVRLVAFPEAGFPRRIKGGLIAAGVSAVMRSCID